MDTTTGGLPYDVPKPSTEDEASSQRGTQVLSDCGLSELPSSIHSEVGDNRLYATFYLQTVMEEVETPMETEKSTNKTIYYMRAEKKDHTKTLKSKSYRRRSKRRWPMKEENLASMKEEFETKITTLQCDFDLKLMKKVYGAHVRTPEKDLESTERVCEPPLHCRCCLRPDELMEQALFYHWQIPPGKEVPVDDHLPETLHEGKSNLEATEDVEDKIKTLDPRVQRPIKTHIEVFGRLPPPASCHKLVNMDLRLKEEFLGQRVRKRPYPAPQTQVDDMNRQIRECIGGWTRHRVQRWGLPPTL